MWTNIEMQSKRNWRNTELSPSTNVETVVALDTNQRIAQVIEVCKNVYLYVAFSLGSLGMLTIMNYTSEIIDE